MHRRLALALGGEMEHVAAFYDHCVYRTWLVWKGMGSVFTLHYIRIYDGEERYFTQVHKDPGANRWVGLLYNFQLNQWEEQVWVTASSSSAAVFGAGWTMFESYGLQNTGCPPLPTIRSAPVQILRETTWQWENLVAPYADFLPLSSYCFPPYNFTWRALYWDWEVSYRPTP